MSKIISGDRLTAYQRWELPSVDQPPPESEPPPTAAPSPVVVPTKAETRQKESRSSKASSAPPTLDEIEAIQSEAHEEGFAAGYQEGRREGREQGYKKGQQEGHTEGYQRGYAEGLAAGRDEVLLRVQKLDQILSYMQQPLENLDATIEEELTKLATEIARQLVRRELRASPGEVVAVVREAVSLLPVGSAGIQVRLHPDDARLIREVLSLGRDDEPIWKIVEDQTLSRGGCIINAELSRIDATVEKRLGTVIAAVLGDERESHVSHS